jgi:transposase-like protein
MSKNMTKIENGNKPEITHRKKYDADFKRQVLEVWNSGTYATTVECAKSYGLNENTLYNWIYKAGTNLAVTTSTPDVTILKKELAKARMELDILKKAAIYFANHAK